jgi:hypothetical protein
METEKSVIRISDFFLKNLKRNRIITNIVFFGKQIL